MLAHYLKTTFRNIWKYKTQSLTGIFGLAFAIACFVPALYWIRYETSYDTFYPDSEDIYRIYAVENQSGKVNERVPGILSKKVSEQFPAVEASTIFMDEFNTCKTEEVPHIQLRVLGTDSTFLNVFPQEFVSGDSYQPLNTMMNIVLTESVAIRLFGDVEKAIGQHVQSTFYFFDPPYIVTAVVKDPPPNTNLPFDALLHFGMLVGIAEAPEEMQWLDFNAQMYVKLNPHADIDNLTEELRDYTTKSGVNADFEARMLPISNVRHHLNPDAPFTLNFIQLFVAAGILLLFSAIFNFLNLHLDLFRERIRELRQRTVHGATKGRLIVQMLFELTCSVLLALIFAFCLIILARPAFSGLLSLSMDMSQLVFLFIICGIGIMAVIVVIGLVTFWRISHLAMRPLSKGKTGQPLLRRITVTLQLAVSVVFIVAALVVMMQIRFVHQKELGFNLSGVIQIHGLPPYLQASKRIALIHELTAIPQIKQISTSNFNPQHNAQPLEMITHVEWPGKMQDESPAFNIIPTDHRFADILGLKMDMGEWYSEGGEQKIVLNQEAVRMMGLSEPIGTTIRISIYDVDIEYTKEQGKDVEYKIVGVVNDFHTLSLRSRILPTIFRYSLSSPQARITTENVMYVSVIPGQEEEAIQRINAILPDIDPTFADLRVITLEGLFETFNQSEQAGFKMFSVLAIVCLLISLFGIYAIATASTQRRRKEIAIRKVVGAKVGDIVHIFFREYVLQVIIAGAISLPLAYLAMSHWLQGYAYRTNIPWWLLVGVIIGVIAIVLLTVLGQVLKVANSNPGEVVKSE